MASKSLYKGEDKYACREIVKDYSALGRKFQMTLNGDRVALDALAAKIADAWDANPYYIETIPVLSTAQKALIPSKTIARTPQLKWDGKGLMADLIIIGEVGLLNGDSHVSDQEGDYNVPNNTTSRFVFEPNDVALAYGLPFREGFKWDLTRVANDVLAMDADFSDIPGILESIGYDPDSLTLLALIHIWENGAITEQQRGRIYTYLTAESFDGEGPPEYLERFLRGQTSFRFFLPHVTLVRRYRTMPQLKKADNKFSKPGAIAIMGATGAPPKWTNAPSFPDWGEEGKLETWYKYYATGPQTDFAGEFWVAEEQWSGFLDFDEDLYSNPYPAPEE